MNKIMTTIKLICLLLIFGTVGASNATAQKTYRQNLEWLSKIQERYKDDPEGYRKYVTKQIKIFNDSIKDPKNLDLQNAFSSGEELIIMSSTLRLDITIALATIGYEHTFSKNPNKKYIDFAESMALDAIREIKEDKVSACGCYGAYSYAYKNSEYPASKFNALGWMYYIVAHIKDFQGEKEAALPYFYQATSEFSGAHKNPMLYYKIGEWFDKKSVLVKDQQIARKQANGNIDDTKTADLRAMEKGYLYRALQAYAIAYRYNQNQVSKQKLLEYIKQLYANLFDGKTEGFNMWLAGSRFDGFYSPETPVKPIQ